MRNILLIAKREYLERVRQRSFVIMTVLIPLLMFAAVGGPALLMTRTGNETKRMVVVSPDRDTAEMIRSRIEQREDEKKSDTQTSTKRSLPPLHFSVEIDTVATDAERAALTAKVNQKELDGFLWATPDAIAAKKLDFVTRDTSSFINNGLLGQAVSNALHRASLKSKGFNQSEIDAALEPVDVEAVSPLGKNVPNPEVMFFATFGMVMVLYISVLLYGINVMRSILEEKTSRVMEVMLSTASANEMMAGKIVGVGAVGLTQVVIWAATAAILSAGTLIASASLLKNVVSAKLLISFGVFFLLGYVLYSALCAAVGAMVNSEQEAQQLQFIVMLPIILALLVSVNIFQHPASPLAFWGSIFPFTAPLIMFTRIAMQPPPAPWEIALSIGLMLATIYAMGWLCGRIYRVGILMYGKKPTLPEILKWIKYA